MMLSLIICSKHKTLDNQLTENIHNTIGDKIEYEIIHIDNSDARYSIFQAYNKGVDIAKGDILCFMHEDIRYHTTNWGEKTIKIMSNDNIGALGIAGGNVILSNADWRFQAIHSHAYLKQGYYIPTKDPIYYIKYDTSYPKDIHLKKVAVIDGVWMCFNKEIFKEIHFDDKTYGGFHLYDSDISMQVNNIGKDVFITGDICIEHFSIGFFSAEFVENLSYFTKKWEMLIPFQIGCVLRHSQLEKMQQEADKQLKLRIEEDRMRKNIAEHHKYYQGQALSASETSYLEQEMFQYARCLINNKEYNNKKAWNATKQYFNTCKNKRFSILLKFFWHRMLF